MSTSIQVVFDCADPAALAAFWADALGYVVQPPPDGFDSWEAFLRQIGFPEERWGDRSAVVDPDGVGPRVFFQKVPEGKVVKNRVHLDVNAAAGKSGEERREAIEAEVRRLTGIGAAELYRKEEDGEFWITMRDPEGNEFCVQ